MSAIQSLLRVMTLRDAEAIVLESNKVPSLRRRGAIEPLAMAAIEHAMLAELAAPLRAARARDGGTGPMLLVTDDGARYQVTIDDVPGGLRLLVRPGKPEASGAASGAANGAAKESKAEAKASAVPSAEPPKARAWWARDDAPATPAPAPVVSPTIVAAVAAPDAPDRSTGLAQLAAVLAPLVAHARERRASDVIVSTGQARMRIAGRLESLDAHVDDAALRAAVRALGGGDHSLEIDGVRLRVNAFEHLGGAAVAARLIREDVPSLGQLALPTELASLVELRDGLVLVCGPTGAGKSTTLAALIDLLDQRRAAHVITLEDPIEYRFAPRRGLIHQREVGTHVESFAAGLRAALRETPDVILLGELRDRDTIAAALTAAETGHLVLATLHAPNAAAAIDRMIDAMPEGQQRQARWQLAACLRAVVTQYLLPRRDGGVAPAIELVPITPAVTNLIRKGDLQMLASSIQTGRDAGMIPLERSLARLLEAGTVAPNVVKAFAADHDLLAALAGKLR